MALWDPWSDLFNLQSETARWADEALETGPHLSSASDGGFGFRVHQQLTCSWIPVNATERLWSGPSPRPQHRG
ncbi:MAG: hypothetical protein ACYDC5_13500, partial [Candidatus Dormibacteria bacterium]